MTLKIHKKKDYKMSLTIEAHDIEEAFAIALSDYVLEILEYMVDNIIDRVEIEFGTNRPYVYKGCEDYDWTTLGYITVTLQDLDLEIEDLVNLVNYYKGGAK